VTQPAPTPGTGPAVIDLVIADSERTGLRASAELVPLLLERDATGQATYGTRLRANNGRDALTDAVEELADAAIYLCQDFEEVGCPVTRDLYMRTLALAAGVLEVRRGRR
jgi:hypothetical protein